MAIVPVLETKGVALTPLGSATGTRTNAMFVYKAFWDIACVNRFNLSAVFSIRVRVDVSKNHKHLIRCSVMFAVFKKRDAMLTFYKINLTAPTASRTPWPNG